MANNTLEPKTLGILKRGDGTDAVVLLQQLLQINGMYRHRIDGKFGPQTLAAVVLWQQTHMDSRKRWLDVDGVVGPETWWSLINPEAAHAEQGIGKERGLMTEVSSGISSPRQDLVMEAAAEREDGVAESPDGCNYGDGVTKYMDSPDPWCCYFVMWCCKGALGSYPVDDIKRGLVADLWNASKRHKMDRGALYAPIPGDLMVLLYRDASGRLTGTGHVEIVVKSCPRKKRFNTIGGNVGNRVKVCERASSQSSLAGFINLWSGTEHETVAYDKELLSKPDYIPGGGENTNR